MTPHRTAARIGTGGRPGAALVDRRGDRGSGTVLLLGVVSAALVLLVGTTLLVRAAQARGVAQSAADLAALAAAERAAGGDAALVGAGPDRAAGGPCTVARDVAARNGARLTGCLTEPGGIVHVTTAAAAGVGTATASARAGPASSRAPGQGAAADPRGWLE